MARKRVWRGNTPVRYTGKLLRTLKGSLPEGYAEQAAIAGSAEYSGGFGVYRELYRKLLEAFGERIPKAQLGLYRSALFAMYKMVAKGYPVDSVIEKFADPKQGGLDRGLLEDIARYFGLMESSAEKASA